ncbi:DUF3892 domain-containing protein [Micromonospora sp. NPDC052213]|uniref:DUF3892 domain-containing protein n=1 Tax=Micromonospora sp. NPDC052213 TaxID=3155812 RepID=UPI003414194A
MGHPDLAALRPRFTAPARVLLRFADALGAPRDADAGVSPVCGYLVPSSVDRTLEFFDDKGNGYGRLRPDPETVTAWEEVRPKRGRPYLRTVADDASPNNLDSLPECQHVR